MKRTLFNKGTAKRAINNISNVVKKGYNYAIPILGVILLSYEMTDKLKMIRYNVGKVEYDDAVEAIMASNMWSDDKVKAVKFLKRDCESELYKATIDVVNSSMWSHDKVEVIQNMFDYEVIPEEES